MKKTRKITETDRHPYTAEMPLKICVNDKHRSGHQTETRIFSRKIHETFCVQPRCRFRGKIAVQGVCHTTKSAADDSFEMAMRHGQELVDFYRKRYRGKKLTAILEQQLVCIWANGELTLDELVRTRAENATLKDRLSRTR